MPPVRGVVLGVGCFFFGAPAFLLALFFLVAGAGFRTASSPGIATGAAAGALPPDELQWFRRISRSSAATTPLPLMSAGHVAGGDGQGPHAFTRIRRSALLTTPSPFRSPIFPGGGGGGGVASGSKTNSTASPPKGGWNVATPPPCTVPAALATPVARLN